MRVSVNNNGLTVRAIAGAYNVLIGIDLDEQHRAGCLGFSIKRTDKKTGKTRYLPNSVTFPNAAETKSITTETAPLQKFRWGDYTAYPGETYSYTVTARYGKPGALTDGPSATVEVTTENPASPRTAVFFNRGAAASQAYNARYGQLSPEELPADKQKEAFAWLSRGLEEAVLDFLAQAKDSTYALHAAIYEFQKPNLLAGLKAAVDRGAELQVVYHYRHKGGTAKDETWKKNEAAAQAAGLTAYCTQRKSDPGVIMHNKFVVLLKKDGSGYVPQAVWTGSTNWTEGGIYGQLNVGHAVYDPEVAKTYEAYFQLLKQDLPAAQTKAGVVKLSPVPADLPGPGVLPILSPQQNLGMLDLYGKIAAKAKCLFISAPFQLAPQITQELDEVPSGTLHYLLLDKEASLGTKAEIDVIEHAKGTNIGFAAPLASALSSFQGQLLKDTGPEHFHHPGIHIHSKIILADPFGDDPILVTGSANFSRNSTVGNDSNSLLIRGDTAVADIYATEFMRMFEHYHFRASVKKASQAKPDQAIVLTLKVDDSWTQPFYEEDSNKALDRMVFAGTLPASTSAASTLAASISAAPAPAPTVKKEAPAARKPAAPKAAKEPAAKKKAAAPKDDPKPAAKKASAPKAPKKPAAKKKVTASRPAPKVAVKKKPAAAKPKAAAPKRAAAKK